MYVTHTEKVELVDFKICYAQYHGHNWSDTCLRSWSHPDLSLHQGCTLPLSHIYLWNTFSPSLLPLTGALVMNSSGWGHWAQTTGYDQAYLVRCGVCLRLGSSGLDPVSPEEHLPSIHKSCWGLRRSCGGLLPVTGPQGHMAELLTRCLSSMYAR